MDRLSPKKETQFFLQTLWFLNANNDGSNVKKITSQITTVRIYAERRQFLLYMKLYTVFVFTFEETL